MRETGDIVSTTRETFTRNTPNSTRGSAPDYQQRAIDIQQQDSLIGQVTGALAGHLLVHDLLFFFRRGGVDLAFVGLRQVLNVVLDGVPLVFGQDLVLL